MSKIHITLVGGQPAPIYHGIVATKPDKVVYIYSENSVKTLNKLKQELDIESEEHILSPTNPKKIRRKAEILAEQYKNDEVTVNISSGLKSWTYFFSVVFGVKENASIVYVDQNNVLWNYRTMEGTSAFEFDMRKLFRLHDNPIDGNYTPLEAYTVEDFLVIEKLEFIRKMNPKTFNNLTTILTKEREDQLKNVKSGMFECPRTGSFLEWHKGTSSNSATFKMCNRWGKETFKLASPNLMRLLFHAGWFELKVADILSKHPVCTEVCLGCRFPSRKGADKNEVDIIANFGAKILFVECKTQITKISDIDKFNSVVRNYGGMGSKGLFITLESMTDVARQKCEEHGLLMFSMRDKERRAVPKQVLYDLLDSELANINIK